MSQTQTLHPHLPPSFKAASEAAIADPQLRQNFRGAMNFLMSKRAAQFTDGDAFEQLRSVAENIRQHSLSRLPELLEKLEASLQKNGVQVHWAETPEQANAIVLDIARRAQGDLIVKGKSMVSEEIELNHAMAGHGVDCLESDMGEYIVQMAGERPSHIIMPAIHKTKEEIARLFAERVPGVDYTDSVDELIQIGRRVLREKFRDTKIGLSGVNVAVAETGTICLVENEGNGRMCTTVPDVHIAVTGIEKVVDTLDQVPPILALLTRSATGQAVTTYFNWITGPRRTGELDGPKEVHLILLDNGRSQAYADEQLRKTLQCIRCGACMNHCPVYTRIGGLAYGTTYPGPIGKIVSPHLLGLKATHPLVTASTLCGACGEVCPVRIPIPDLLIRLRAESQRSTSEPSAMRESGAGRTAVIALSFRLWSWIYRSPALYRMFAWAATRFRSLAPTKQGAWTDSRSPMKPARSTFRERLAERRR